MFRSIRFRLITAVGLLISIPCATLASQHHSGYARAMEDLRLARALLQRGNMGSSTDGSQDEVSLAISNIDGAMTEILKEAPGVQKRQKIPQNSICALVGLTGYP